MSDMDLSSAEQAWRDSWGVRTTIALFLSHNLSFCRSHFCITWCSLLPRTSGGAPQNCPALMSLPSSMSEGSGSFWFSSTIRGTGIAKRQIHKFIKPSLPTAEAVSCVGLVVVGN